MRFVMPTLTHVYHVTVPGGPCTLAAIVATDDLQVAFASTNHIEDLDWRKNQNVLATMWSTRSTCVGDYMQQGDKLYQVEERGFSCVNSPINRGKNAVETARRWIAARRSKWNI